MSQPQSHRVWQQIVMRDPQKGFIDHLWSFILSKECFVLACASLTFLYGAKATASWWGSSPERFVSSVGGPSTEALLWGALFFVLLAHLLERGFLLWGPMVLPLRADTLRWQRHFLLDDDEELEMDDVKDCLQDSFADVRFRGDVGWAERGRGALIGELWVLASLIVILGSIGISSVWNIGVPWTRVAMVMMPWLSFGLLMQLSEPYRCVAFWAEDDVMFLWASSAQGGMLLADEIEDIHEELFDRIAE